LKKAIFWVTGIVFAGKVLFSMANIAQGVLLSEFIAAFSLESSYQGVPNAAANAGVLTATLLAVPIAARVGRLRMFSAAMGAIALMLLLAGAAPTALLLSAAYALMGFSFGCVDTTASAIVADLHPGPRAPVMMGMLHAAYGMGGILAPIVMMAALQAGATWRAVLTALSAAVFVAFLICLVIFGRARDHLPKEAKQEERLTRAGLLRFVRKPGNMAIVLCAACYCAHQASIYLWIERVIGEGLGSATLGAAALSLFWVGTVVSRLVLPRLQIETGRYMGYGMLLVTFVLLLGAITRSAAVLCAVSGLVGLLGGAALPVLIAESTRRNPGQSMLSVTSVLLTTGFAAMICAPLIGFIVGKTALIAVIYVSAVFALLCAGFGFRIRGEGAVLPQG